MRSTSDSIRLAAPFISGARSGPAGLIRIVGRRLGYHGRYENHARSRGRANRNIAAVLGGPHGLREDHRGPEEGRIGFAILARDGAELMLQTVSSVLADQPEFAPLTGSTAALFIEVEDFADVLRRLAGYPVDMPERTTFYGMREIGVRDPGGHVVVFAARA